MMGEVEVGIRVAMETIIWWVVASSKVKMK